MLSWLDPLLDFCMRTTQEEMQKEFRRRILEETLRASCLESVKERVERFLSIDRLLLTPHTHFSTVSSECVLLYRDGYYFACIALCQAVAEALTRFLCEKSMIRCRGSHEARIHRLSKESVISQAILQSFETIHEHRDDFHHLNPQVPSDHETLRLIAHRALSELSNIEYEVFGFSVQDGEIIPHKAKFWSKEGREGKIEDGEDQGRP